MKKLFYIPALMVSYLITTAASCQHDDNSNPTPANPVVNTTPAGSGWRVSLFNERSENKTNDYTGYTFEFASSGTMTAVRNGQTTNGTWRQFRNDGLDRFEIQLSTTDNNLQELNDDWVIVSKSDALISLKDDNPTSNEQLQFSK